MNENEIMKKAKEIAQKLNEGNPYVRVEIMCDSIKISEITHNEIVEVD